MKIIIKKFFEEITFLGGILFYLIFLLFFLINKDYFSSLIIFSGIVLIYFITLGVRTFYFKSRPKKVKYKNFLEKIDASSFPSIHSARSIFIFLFLIFYVIADYLVLFLLLVLTFLVMYSRIYLKKHNIMDLLGGILLAIFSFVIISLIY